MLYLGISLESFFAKRNSLRIFQKLCSRDICGISVSKYFFLDKKTDILHKIGKIGYLKRRWSENIFLQRIFNEWNTSLPNSFVLGLQMGSKSWFKQIFF
jgi:hypothetical protein